MKNLGGELNTSVAEWLNKGLTAAWSPNLKVEALGVEGVLRVRGPPPLSEFIEEVELSLPLIPRLQALPRHTEPVRCQVSPPRRQSAPTTFINIYINFRRASDTRGSQIYIPVVTMPYMQVVAGCHMPYASRPYR